MLPETNEPAIKKDIYDIRTYKTKNLPNTVRLEDPLPLSFLSDTPLPVLLVRELLIKATAPREEKLGREKSL